MADAGIGLSPAEVDQVFPFHFVLDGERRLRQRGSALRRLDPAFIEGTAFDQVFEMLWPKGKIRGALSVTDNRLPVIIRHRPSGIRMRGDFLGVGSQRWMFIGSPWFESAQALEASGLSLTDFPPNDPIVDLLMMERTRQMTLEDLRTLASRLETQRSELARTEDVYRRAISAANAVPYRESFATDSFEFIGAGIAEMTGVPAEEMTPALLEGMVLETSEEAAAEDSAGSPVTEAGHRRRDLSIRTRSGQVCWLGDSSVPVLDESGLVTGRVGILMDITRRRDRESRLRASEERASQLAEEARRLSMVAARTDNAVVLTDTARRIEWVNEGFTRITGYTLEEVRGRVPGHFLQGPETDPGTVQMIRERLGAGLGFQCEIRNRRKDGGLYWASLEVQPFLDQAGNHAGYMSVGSDITARRQYEERLRVLSAELETILQFSPDGYVLFDSRGRLSYCSTAFEQMMGVDRADVLGLEFAQIDQLLAAACDPSHVPAALRSLRPGTTDRLVLKGPPKGVLLRSVIPILGSRGSLRGQILFLHDVTREDELQQLKSEFLATAAHELRTPMTSVQGFSELLMEEALDPETVRDVAAVIHRQSSMLVSMVNDLLDLQRIEQRRGREFEASEHTLQTLIRKVVSELKVSGDSRRVSLEGLPEPPIRILCDGPQLGQALTNVLNNAYKYSPGGGEILLTVEHRVQDGVPQVGIRTRDQGIGMTPEQLRHIFERFYRADPSGSIPGTGLGMSLVKEVVELHDGSVEVESEQGVGTTVTLWLPAGSGEPASEQAPETA